MKKYSVINRALLSLGVLWFFCHTYFEIGDLVITFKIVIFCHNLCGLRTEKRDVWGGRGGGRVGKLLYVPLVEGGGPSPSIQAFWRNN
jgi:hypothetical protein